jgi:hypothetical protein
MSIWSSPVRSADMTPPNLLNDDGRASMATMLMLSHHAFRCDLLRFAAALRAGSPTEAQRAAWDGFREHLHGHHTAEDTGVFPGLAAQHASVRATIDGLEADHRRIDPMLARPLDASLIADVRGLLDPHLALEEAEIIPFLRDAHEFPAPPDDAAAALYADGFAWAMHGIADDVAGAVCAMLPESIVRRLPAAQAEYAARLEAVWGPQPARASRTPVPV